MSFDCGSKFSTTADKTNKGRNGPGILSCPLVNSIEEACSGLAPAGLVRVWKERDKKQLSGKLPHHRSNYPSDACVVRVMRFEAALSPEQ